MIITIVIVISCSTTLLATDSGQNLTTTTNSTRESLWMQHQFENEDDIAQDANRQIGESLLVADGGPESRLEVQASFLQLATKILELNDIPKREETTLFMAQDQLARKRQNKGKAAGMAHFTRSPIMHDVGCEGALPIKCNRAARFRTISGICNNLDHPLWGSASSRLARFVPPSYADGRAEPRGSLNPDSCDTRPPESASCPRCFSDPKAQLPSARQISLTFHRDFSKPDRRLTHMMAQFGQFLDHDIALSPEAETEEDCCNATDEEHQECFPIWLPRNDPVYKNAQCLDFKRSIGFCNASHVVLEQVNAITSFVDASMVYGSSPDDSLELRQLSRGKLKASINFGDGKEFLPLLGNGRDENGTAGDVRANEQPGLASMHVVFLREHNRLVDLISNEVDTLSDEQVYQYARQIVAAQIQNIVYKDWLPILLGERTMAQFRLFPDYRSDYYCDKTDPSIRNSFSTAAFRFGHSMIQGMFELFSPKNRRQRMGSFRLRDSFFSREQVDNVEQIITGLFRQNAQTFDEAVTEDLGDFLFKNLNGMGSDLLARNIQRGRDHGLPGYNEFREFCEMDRVCSFSETPPEMPEGPWRRLASFYDSPSDVDLFTAGLIETAYEGGLVGRTFNCIIAKQFQSLKFGDRFFYTLQQNSGSRNSRSKVLNRGPFRFTPEQLDNIMSRSLGDIVCDNTDLREVPLNAFLAGSKFKKCNNNNKLDIPLLLQNI